MAPVMAESDTLAPQFRLNTGTHTQAIHQIAVSTDGRLLVTAAETTLRVWDIETRKPLRMLLGEVTDPAALLPGTGNVERFALSHDGRWVALLRSRIMAGANPARAQRFTQVQVFELATGDLRAGLDYPGLLFDLDFSHDDRYLALSGQATGDSLDGLARGIVRVYATGSVLKARIRRPPEPLAEIEVGSARCESLPPSALRFLPVDPALPADYRLVWAARQPHPQAEQGGHLGWFAFSRAEGLREVLRMVTPLVLNPTTLAVGPDSLAIAAHIQVAQPSVARQFFCLDHRGQALARVVTEARPASLAFSKSGKQLLVGMAAEDEPGVATVRACVYDGALGGFTLRSTYYGHDDSVAAAAFLDDVSAVSAGGDNHALHVWSPACSEGASIGVIRGVGREVWRVAIDAQGQISFNTLPPRLLGDPDAPGQRIFDLRTMTLRARSADDPADFEHSNAQWRVMPASLSIGLKSLGDHAGAASALTFSSGYQEEVSFFTPDLNLFVGADDEWVMWSPSGYYAASPRGARHFGFHVNRGGDREALFFPSDRFKLFYRPDIIQAVLTHGSEALARERGFDIAPVDVASILPPVVEMDRNGVKEKSGLISFRFTVRSRRRGHPVTRVWILQNDQFVWTAPHISTRYAVNLPLRSGRNHFAILAETAHARSIAIEHVTAGSAPAPAGAGAADRKKDRPPARGKLFLLSVGVSDFEVAGRPEAGDFKPLAFAHRDALAIHNALAKGRYSDKLLRRAQGRNRAFKSVEASVLLNESATKDKIITEVSRLCALIQQRSQAARAPRDVLFVFLAGHGVRVRNEPELYFWNHDLRPGDLKRTGLSLIELGRLITSVRAEVVLAIDACHSGMAGANVMLGLDPDELASRIHAVNERGMYILNSSRSEQLAFEHPDDAHGFFTKAVLDTLRLEKSLLAEHEGHARSVSMLGLMASVQELVPYYTKGKQSSVCRVYGDLLPLTIFKH
jgi:uncharacterized caspase-like protein/WD40 repeat protein